MGMENFFASLPRGKKDKPLLFSLGPLVYDFHDIDGLYFMLDRKLSGCLLMMWSKPMNPSVQGEVTFDGEPFPGCILQSMEVMGGMWILALPLRGRVTEYGKAYALHVQGYQDTDGNTMAPQDFTITGIEKVRPEPRFAAHEAVALQAAREGIVLLRNDHDVLPLPDGTTLNLFGKGIHQFRTGAVGAGKINPRYTVDFLEAVRQDDTCSLNEELVQFYGNDRDDIPPPEMLDRARMLSNTALMFLSRPAGENMDLSSSKGEFYLTDEEDALIRKLTETFAHTVVILNTGYPMDVRWAEKCDVDGLVYLGFGGMLAGTALLDILTGRENPSGKLPDTWALDYFDIPASRNFYDCADKPRLHADSMEYLDTVYEEDIYVGYRYFETFRKRVAYPFGFGLSYTHFVQEAAEIQWDGQELHLKIFVKNMGNAAGKEVIQVYVGKPATSIEKPLKDLVSFEKTRLLQPGEMEEFPVSIPAAHLAVYDEQKAAWLLEAGNYQIYVGNNAASASCWGHFTVAEDMMIHQVKNRMQPRIAFPKLSQRNPKGTYPTGSLSGVVKGKTSFLPYANRNAYPADFHTRSPENRLTFADVKTGRATAEALVSQLSVAELARLSVCASAGWGMEGVGEAGSLYPVDDLGLPKFPVADGNSGVNLNVKNIGMPSGATLCATWNRNLCEEVGRVIGEEAKALGIPLILAPALNIHRNPLNGRQPEYFSEDPFLAGVMAGMYSRGMESAGVGSCMKHLIANNCESSRKRNQSILSERAIREIYFRAFEYAMEIHMPASVMTAYNAVNGIPTAADADLIQGLLREEMGFDGFVMTDWTTYDTVDVASMVQAGNCWITPGTRDSTYVQPIIDGVANGTIDIRRLRENVTYLIKTVVKFV